MMKLSYDPGTDSLYIDLNERPGTDAQEIVDGMVVDFDAEGRPVSIDIQHASIGYRLSAVGGRRSEVGGRKNGPSCVDR